MMFKAKELRVVYSRQIQGKKEKDEKARIANLLSIIPTVDPLMLVPVDSSPPKGHEPEGVFEGREIKQQK